MRSQLERAPSTENRLPGRNDTPASCAWGKQRLGVHAHAQVQPVEVPAHWRRVAAPVRQSLAQGGVDRADALGVGGPQTGDVLLEQAQGDGRVGDGRGEMADSTAAYGETGIREARRKRRVRLHPARAQARRQYLGKRPYRHHAAPRRAVERDERRRRGRTGVQQLVHLVGEHDEAVLVRKLNEPAAALLGQHTARGVLVRGNYVQRRRIRLSVLVSLSSSASILMPWASVATPSTFRRWSRKIPCARW